MAPDLDLLLHVDIGDDKDPIHVLQLHRDIPDGFASRTFFHKDLGSIDSSVTSGRLCSLSRGGIWRFRLFFVSLMSTLSEISTLVRNLFRQLIFLFRMLYAEEALLSFFLHNLHPVEIGMHPPYKSLRLLKHQPMITGQLQGMHL
jgi:hypothetical protein